MTASFAALIAMAAIGQAPADPRVAPAKEPSYESKSPKYALLTFGSAAPTRVWLVFDGHRVFVDRNGNGDLTEAGESFTPDREESTDAFDVFVVPYVSAGKQKHKNLRITRFSRDGSKAGVSIEIADFGQQSAGADRNGTLAFASRPADAPVVRFNAPLTMTLNRREPLFRNGDKAIRFNACVGTPGIGEGTFAYVHHDDLDEALIPKAEIEFVSRNPGEKSIREKVSLEHRC